MTLHFAHPLPWWAVLAVLAAAAGVAAYAYRRTVAPLTGGQRATLAALRWLTLLALVVFLLRPVVPVHGGGAATAVVGVLVDVSRSMGLRDGDRRQRLERAVAAARAMLPSLERQYRVEVFAIGETLAPARLDDLAASARRTDLSGSLRAAEERLSGRNAAGLILLSDGADTARGTAASRERAITGLPIVTVGVGEPRVGVDREIRAVTVGPSSLDASLVELTATGVVHGTRGPVRLRLLQDRRLVEVRDVSPPADGSPIQEVFRVAPDRTSAAVYRVEMEHDPSELTAGNNGVDVLVGPPGRRRRLLMIEGAPGFEHTFLRRAWQQDPSLEVDSVVRKGRNDQGADTFYVQAAAGRAALLTSGFPSAREALFAYDTIVLANIEAEGLGRDRLQSLAEFVETRGGGLLLFGARSFSRESLARSVLEPLVPVEVNDRRGLVARAAATNAERFKASLTEEGTRHPVMRLPAATDGVERRWSALPPLAGAAALGAPRAGASVLAVTTVSAGVTVPLVAVQRFGAGRTMVFGGEASWRWRMMMPSSDRSYEAFWRQSARWLAGEAPEPLDVRAPAGAPLGDPVEIAVAARTEAFTAVPDAVVTVAVRTPNGETRTLDTAAAADGVARAASFLADEPGVYRVSVDARRGDQALGRVERLVLAGGVDPELVDPRLNEPVLRRIAEDSGGRYLPVSEASAAADVLETLRGTSRPPEYRDAWHTGWAFALIVALLAWEWVLRRRWGLR